VRARHVVAGFDDDSDRRLRDELGFVEPSEIEARERYAATELGEDRRDRAGFAARLLRIRTDDDRAHSPE
jgi:hypothetical protein